MPVSSNLPASPGQNSWHFTEIKGPWINIPSSVFGELGGHSSLEANKQKCFSLQKQTRLEALLALKNPELDFRPCQRELESRGVRLGGSALALPSLVHSS